MRLKAGVRIFGIRPELVLALGIADDIWRQHGPVAEGAVVTSVMDGVHQDGSDHYRGTAVDLRVTTLDDPAAATAALRAALGEDFVVLLERTPPHVHVSFRPQRPYTGGVG